MTYRQFEHPLTRRLITGHHRGPIGQLPSRRLMVLGSIGLLLITLGSIEIAEGAIVSQMLLLCPAFVIGPFVAAALAAVITSRDARSQQFDLLALTPLTDAQLVRSYFWAAFHKLRVLLVTTGVFLPALAVYITHLLLLVNRAFYDIQYRAVYSSQPPRPPPAADIVQTGSLVAALFVGLWGLNLVGLALGVGLGLLTRQVVVAAVGAPVLLLVLVLAIVGVLAGLLLVWPEPPAAVVDSGLGLLAVLPYLLSWVLLHLSEQFTRQVMH